MSKQEPPPIPPLCNFISLSTLSPLQIPLENAVTYTYKHSCVNHRIPQTSTGKNLRPDNTYSCPYQTPNENLLLRMFNIH